LGKSGNNVFCGECKNYFAAARRPASGIHARARLPLPVADGALTTESRVNRRKAH
jgi:hypothetical protein